MAVAAASPEMDSETPSETAGRGGHDILSTCSRLGRGVLTLPDAPGLSGSASTRPRALLGAVYAGVCPHNCMEPLCACAKEPENNRADAATMDPNKFPKNTSSKKPNKYLR